MVEGRGYAGRREERLRAERLRKLIEEKDRIVVIPDIEGIKKAEKGRSKKREPRKALR